MTTTLALFGNKVLRSAIQRNLVSFPAQLPALAKHQNGDLQARISQLYFIGGWTVRDIGKRYSMSSEMVRKSLTEWRVRAISSGYIQEIGPDVLPALATSSESASEADLEDDAPDAVNAMDASSISSEPLAHARGSVTDCEPAWSKPLQVVTKFAPQLEAQADTISVLHMVLDEIEEGVGRGSGWPAFCVRLLRILRHECIQAGFHLSTAQIDRMEDVVEVSCEQASDLLRDLRNRIADEERCTPVLIPLRSSRVALFQVLVREIEISARLEENLWKADGGGCPRHCRRFVLAIKQGCQELGMEFSLVQAKRIENALPLDPERLRDLLRDLRNRLADEQEQIALIRVPHRPPRQMIAGNYR